ncbi:MAG: methyltransferase family protein [Bacteroidales bacterium]
MALVHDFERSGNWLFRRRGWIPVLFAVPGIAVLYFTSQRLAGLNLKTDLVFLAVSIFGQVIRAITAGFAPGRTSGRNTTGGQIADELNITGMYSIVRHPLYIGNFFMWLGPVLFIRSVWFIVVFILVYWLYYERIMFAEEQFLRRRFGEAYDRWSEKVKAVIPSFKYYVAPKLPFSFLTVIRREYNSFVNIFVIFTILDLVRNYGINGKIIITPLWGVLFLSAGLIWLVVRIIHKNTRWLTVEGR